MAIVETLEVRFRADMGRLGDQLAQLAGRVGSLSAAFEGGKTSLASGASGMIESIAAALKNGAAMNTAPAEAGRMMTDKFSRALAGGTASAAAAAKRVSAAAKFSNSAAAASARSAGAALSQGFANGISSRYGAVMSAVNRIVNAAVSRIRSALRIHSPSRVSFELGGYFGEGFAEGINASVRMAEQSVNALSVAAAGALNPSAAAFSDAADAGGITGAVQAAVNDALGGTNIVIPLNVDGMKLGEASIRGINRFTRSAGRVMLEI